MHSSSGPDERDETNCEAPIRLAQQNKLPPLSRLLRSRQPVGNIFNAGQIGHTTLATRVFIGLATLSLAVFLRILLNPILKGHYPYLTFFPTVLIAALYARWRIAAVIALASGFLAERFFSFPLNQFTIDAQHLIALTTFWMVCAAIIGLIEAMHCSQARAQQATAEAAASRNAMISLNAELDERVRTRTTELETAHGALRAVIDGSPDPMASVDLERRLTAFNVAYGDEFQARFGVTPVIGAKMDDLLAGLPSEQAKLLMLWQRALQGLMVSEETFGHAQLGERTYQINSSFIRDSSGRPTELVYSVRDITEQRALQRRLQEMNEGLECEVAARTCQLSEAMHALEAARDQLQLVVDNVPAGVIYCDGEQRLRFANRYYAGRFGKMPSDLIGKRVADVVGHEAYATVQAEVERALRGETLRFEREVPFVQLGTRIMELNYAPDVAPSGVVRGFVALISDITERKRVESALRDAETKLRHQAVELEELVATRTAKLVETVTELESFAYSVAHDLRAPLRAITSLTALLESEFGATAPPDARDYMQRTRRAATRMDALIRDLLILSRVGRTEVSFRRIDLDALVEILITESPDLQPPAAEVIVLKPLGVVVGNEMLLTQALSNLLGNAVKFVSGKQPRIVVRSERINSEVRLWVEDNGIGIAPQYHKKIFGIFERLGGRVGVESEPGLGSHFWFELPAVVPKDRSAPVAISSTAPARDRSVTFPEPPDQQGS